MCKRMVIGLLVSLILCSAGANENCNKDMLQRCAMDLPVLNSPEISFALTREELDKSCIKLHSGITCIDNYTSSCMSKHEQTVFRKIYSGISDGMKELCTPGAYQDEYLKHARCVKIFWADYEQCSRKYEGTLTHLNSPQKNTQYAVEEHDISTSHEDYLRTVCCSFQEFMSCSEQTVQRTCGDEAAVFTSKFLKQMASNIIKVCSQQRVSAPAGQRTCGDEAAVFTSKFLKQMTSNIIKVSSQQRGSAPAGQRTCGDEAAVFTSKFLKQMASNIIKVCSQQRVSAPAGQRTCGDEAAVFTSKFLKQMASNIIKVCSQQRVSAPAGQRTRGDEAAVITSKFLKQMASNIIKVCSQQRVSAPAGQRTCGDEAAVITSKFLKQMASNIIKVCSQQRVSAPAGQRTCGDEPAVFTSKFLKQMASNIIKVCSQQCVWCSQQISATNIGIRECSVAGKASNTFLSLQLIFIAFSVHLAIRLNLVPT